jgi:SAM-dependent methyltransferase
MIGRVSAAPFDYDTTPDRWGSLDRTTQLGGDAHAPVAARIVDANLTPVIDAGGGDGELGRHLPPGWPLVTLDLSPTMLASAPHPKVRARTERLPLATGTAGAVTMLWMLYHLDHPEDAVAEAWRVLRPGGLFAASTAARDSDPELTDGYPPTTFDAEEAEGIVRRVFSDVTVVRWDAKLTRLDDADQVARFCVHHGLPPSAAQRVAPPVLLTKRGCLVYARKEHP